MKYDSHTLFDSLKMLALCVCELHYSFPLKTFFFDDALTKAIN